MEQMTNVNVRISAKDKEEATNLLESMGLTMSTLINMTIKQLIKKRKIPFDIEALDEYKSTEEFMEVYDEGEQILTKIKSGEKKGYTDVKKMFKDILKDD